MDELTISATAKSFPTWESSYRYFVRSQIGKQGKPVQVYKLASRANRSLFPLFAHSLVGAASPIPFEHPLARMAARSF